MADSFNLLYSNDKKGVHTPSWYSHVVGETPKRAQLEGSQSCDVCIVGAGFTGLSAALHLAQLGYTVKVVEAHRVGWGASGRNGGQVGTGQRMDQDYLEKNYGLENAKGYWSIAEDAKNLVRQLIKDHSISCNLENGIIHADHRERYLNESKEYAEKLNRDYDYDKIRFLNNEELGTMVKSPSYFGGTLDEGAFHINPLAYALGLARAGEKAGAEIHEMSEVTHVEQGKMVKVRTSGGDITANFLIYACNGYLGKLNVEIADKVLPINNFVIATEPLSANLRAEVMPTKAAVADSKFVVNYFRMTHDGRLLFGGGENYGYRFPADIKAFVRKPMLEIFPQLADTKIHFGWGGTLAITMKRLPLFQRLASNIMTCTGYSGHGVAMASMAGKIAADAINGQASKFDLMSQLQTPRFPGGTLLRYPMLIAAMTWFSLRDKL